MNLIRELPSVKGIPPFDAPDDFWNISECWRRDYVTVKYSVAKLLQPKRICEIGVYSGIAALSFLQACPTAQYVGIDNLYSEKGRGIQVVSRTKDILRELGYDALIFIEDSQAMDCLPLGSYDLVHVDGDHSRSGAKHDVMLAWNALMPKGHILIDNGHDMSVCAGTFDAMVELAGGRLINWHYLEDSVGNILIHKEFL